MTQQWGQPGPYGRQGQGEQNRSGPGQGGFGQGGFGQGGFGQGGFGQGGQNPGWQQPSGWGQGYGPPGGRPVQPGGQQPPMPGPGRPSSVPPQRPNPLRKVLIGVIALATIALAGLVVVNFTVGGADSAYQNEDYQPPPPAENPPELPVPETEEEARQLIEENAVYEQSVPSPVRCEMEPISEGASDEELNAHLNELMACLMRVWEGPVSDADWEIVRPSVTVYGDEVETKCGTSPGGNAFYCAADQQVYYSRSLPDTIPDLKGSRWGPDLVLAHEFGHALQARTGILISTSALEQQLGEENPEALELSRRLELQADCLSGQFMASTSQSLGISQDEVPAMEKVFVAIGDDTLSGDPSVIGNHGRAESRLYWARQGISNSDVSACNSYTAESDQVR